MNEVKNPETTENDLALGRPATGVMPPGDWTPTTTRPEGQKGLPPERRIVLLRLRDDHWPRLGHVKYAAGDRTCPFWVVFTAREDHRITGRYPDEKITPIDVLGFWDCLPDEVANQNVRGLERQVSNAEPARRQRLTMGGDCPRCGTPMAFHLVTAAEIEIWTADCGACGLTVGCGSEEALGDRLADYRDVPPAA